MTQGAGWYRTEEHPYDLRWWNGTAWEHAFWPHSKPTGPYLPGVRRWNISTERYPVMDVAGEAWHLDAIGQILTRMPKRDQEVEEFDIAELVPEPDNPHDVNAVSVRLQGRVVGYLEKDSARVWGPVIRQLVSANVVPTVAARIWAVTRFIRNSGRDELRASIRLSITSPELVLARNDPPASPHALIPWGRSLQVTGEQDHFDVLSAYVDAGRLIATLHAIEVAKARSTSIVLEVRLDGRRVGQLSPATSTALMPLVEEAVAIELTAAVWAQVKGSRLAAEVTVHPMKAGEIHNDWPSEDYAHPTLAPVRQVPRAYISDDPITAPPRKGLFSKRAPRGARPMPSV